MKPVQTHFRRTAVLFGAIVAAALATSACATLGDRADTGVVNAAMPGQVEPIHAAALVNDLAVFWVSSNGCTGKDDLMPVVSLHGDASVITLRRIAEDRCETPVEDGVEMIWSFEELGLKPGARVSVNNPYQLPAT